MKGSRVVGAMCLLLLLSLVETRGEATIYYEDYESYLADAVPLESSFYDLSPSCENEIDGDSCYVVNGGLLGTNRALLSDRRTGTLQLMDFTIKPELRNVTTFSFWFGHLQGTADLTNNEVRFFQDTNSLWVIDYTVTNTWAIVARETECDVGGSSVDDTGLDARNGSSYRFSATMNWATNSFTWTLGSASGSGFFIDCSDEDQISLIRHDRNTPLRGDLLFDEWLWNGTARLEDEPPVEQEPDSGDLFGPDGIFYGGNKTNVAESMQVSETALDAMYGFLWVFILGGIGFGAARAWGAVAGAGMGGIIAFAFGLFPIWVLFFVVFLGVAGFFAWRRNG